MRRLAGRRAFLEELAWDDLSSESSPELAEPARVVWTQSAFSEYASAAAFAEIASALLAAGAPIDLVAASGDFVADEMLHAGARDLGALCDLGPGCQRAGQIGEHFSRRPRRRQRIHLAAERPHGVTKLAREDRATAGLAAWESNRSLMTDQDVESNAGPMMAV